MTNEGPVLRPPSARLRDEGTAAGGRGPWLLIAFALLLAGAGAVIWLLPAANAPQPATPSTTVPPAATPPATPQPAPSPQQNAATEAQKAWISARTEAEIDNMPLWGGEDYNAALAVAKEAAAHLDKGDFEQAQAGFRQATADLAQIAAEREQRLNAAIEAGQEALAGGDGGQARAAFDMALAIDSENALALKGRKRAATIGQVTKMLAQARRAGDPRQAREILRQALAIDPDFTPAGDLLRDVEQQLHDLALRRALGQVDAALARRDLDGADNALRKAASLAPQAGAVRERQARLAAMRRDRDLQALLAAAVTAAKAEDWRQAAEHYTKALALDPQSLAAREGRARAERNAALYKALRAIIAAPERLRESQVAAQAADTIRLARAADTGPILRDLVSRAAAALQRAAAPVPVTFSSDNETEVVILKVGRLGRFLRRTIPLAPGPYVVTGHRRGYRDLRETITVDDSAGAANHFDIRCREKI